MRKNSWTRWLMGIAGGSIMLQTGGCTEAAIGLTTLASTITAGGVVFIISRILE